MRKLRMHWTQHPDKRQGLYRYDPKTNTIEVLDKGYEFKPDFKFVMSPAPAGGSHPGVRSPWYDIQCARKGDSRAVAMDLDIDAGGSVSQFFDPLMIRELQGLFCYDAFWEGDIIADDAGVPIRLEQRKGGPLQLWLNPMSETEVPAGRYVIGGDVSHGTGATPSCLGVGNAGSGEKVGQYRSATMDPKAYAVAAVALAQLFRDHDGNGAFLLWEMQGPGIIFGNRVLELGYFNIFYRTNEMAPFKRQPAVTPGWVPTPDSKDKLLGEYRYALWKRRCLNRSKPALEECLSFKYCPDGHVRHSGEEATNDPTGAKINHGDQVVADALMWKGMDGKGVKAPGRASDEARVGSLAWRRQLRDNERREAEAWCEA